MSASCVQHIPRTYAFSSPVQKTMFIDGRYLAPGLGRVCHVSPETALRGKQQAIPGANTRSHPLPRVFRALHERIINLVCSPRTRARIGRPAAFARTREASGACVSRQPASQPASERHACIRHRCYRPKRPVQRPFDTTCRLRRCYRSHAT